jgi:hypothetical protein
VAVDQIPATMTEPGGTVEERGHFIDVEYKWRRKALGIGAGNIWSGRSCVGGPQLRRAYTTPRF